MRLISGSSGTSDDASPRASPADRSSGWEANPSVTTEWWREQQRKLALTSPTRGDQTDRRFLSGIFGRTESLQNAKESGLLWLARLCSPLCPRFCKSLEERSQKQDMLYMGRAHTQTDKAAMLLRRILQGSLSNAQRADLELVLELVLKMDHQERVEDIARQMIMNDDEHDSIDSGTQMWLLGSFFSASSRIQMTMKMAATVVQATLRFKAVGAQRRHSANAREVLRRQVLDPCKSVSLAARAGVEEELEELNSWNGFDVFRLASLLDGKPLVAVALSIWCERHFVDIFHFCIPKLEAFFAALESSYKDLPYHNSMHAAEVMQTVHCLLHLPPLDDEVETDGRGECINELSELESMAALLASAAHDVGHPGVSNDFRIKARDEDALTYNDQHVNEHMHCALAWRLLRREELSILENLTHEQYASVRKLFIDVVLATDMASHFPLLKRFTSAVEAGGPHVSSWQKDSEVFLQVLVHASDISASGKPRHHAIQWTDRVLEEFFRQGDMERAAGRAVSPLCDRETVSKPAAQVGFLKFIVLPTFEALAPVTNMQEGLANARSLHAHWRRLKDEEDGHKSVALAPMTSGSVAATTPGGSRG